MRPCASSQQRLRYAASACSWSVRPVRCQSRRRSSGHPLAASGNAGRPLAPPRQVLCVGTGGPSACRWTSGHRVRLYSEFTVFARYRQAYVEGVGRLYAASFAPSRSPHAPDPALYGSCSTGATSTKAGPQTSSRRTEGCSRPIRHQHAFVRSSPRSRPASPNRRTRPAAWAGRRGTARDARGIFEHVTGNHRRIGAAVRPRPRRFCQAFGSPGFGSRLD